MTILMILISVSSCSLPVPAQTLSFARDFYLHYRTTLPTKVTSLGNICKDAVNRSSRTLFVSVSRSVLFVLCRIAGRGRTAHACARSITTPLAQLIYF